MGVSCTKGRLGQIPTRGHNELEVIWHPKMKPVTSSRKRRGCGDITSIHRATARFRFFSTTGDAVLNQVKADLSASEKESPA